MASGQSVRRVNYPLRLCNPFITQLRTFVHCGPYYEHTYVFTCVLTYMLVCYKKVFAIFVLNVTQNLQQLFAKHYVNMYVVQLDIEPHAKLLPDLLGDVQTKL